MWAKATLLVFISAFLSACGASVVLGEAKEVEALRTFTELLRNKVGKDATSAVKALKGETFSQIIQLKEIGSHRASVKSSEATPVVQMHGMGDFANDPFGMVPLANAISEYLGGAYVLNVQIGDSNIQDIMNGFLMNLDDQVDYFANVVKNDVHLTKGFNAVGYSQGNLVIRGYIEKYNDPPVLNFISMHGPLAGVGSFPGCPVEKNFCRAFAKLLGALAYKPFVQEHLAQANYFRDPLKIPDYLAGDRFLADINNEDSVQEPGVNTTYNSNWQSLHSVCLVKALGDTVVVPNDSEWFGFFEDGTFDTIWGFADTPWYKQDLFGLRTLNENKRVFFNVTEGNHLDFSTDYLLDLVGIYFV